MTLEELGALVDEACKSTEEKEAMFSISLQLVRKFLNITRASLKIACKTPIEEMHPESTYTWDNLKALQDALQALRE
jgi:hypothetical protein